MNIINNCLYSIQNLIPQKYFVYICSEGMDTLTYYAFIPFLFQFTVHMTDDHHISTSITNYGILLSIINLSRIFNKYFPILSYDRSYLCIYSFLMSCILAVIAVCNNFSIVLFIFFIKEILGSTISDIYNNLYNKKSVYSSKISHETLNETNNSKIQNSLIIIIFITIISSILYNESKYIKFPLFILGYSLTLTWCMISFITICFIEKKYFKMTSNHTNSYFKRFIGLSSKDFVKKPSNLILKQYTSAEIEAENNYSGIIPSNFIEFYQTNEKARIKYIENLKWRRENHVNELLQIPQDYFHDILELYPHAIHGKSKDNCIVLYEILGNL